MKFDEFQYERPNYQIIKEEAEQLISKIESATSYQAQAEYVDEMNTIRNTIDTMANIASIRYTINTADSFYEAERTYWDEHEPLYAEITDKFYKTMVSSKFKAELEEKLSPQFFRYIECSLKTFSPEIIEDLQEENRLSSEYTKLIASAKIIFEGKEYTLSGLMPFRLSEDRTVREAADKTYFGFFEEKEEQFDENYDALVKIRTKIAKKLGYTNFRELGYVRMMRTDYNAEMVENFRKQVKEYIVPIANKLYERQQQRLGIDKLRYYDENFEFATGNAKPKGDADFILNNGMKMYGELSPETKEFFGFMVESELLDLVNKKGKESGGYCTYIANYKAPFIFSNFNGTSDDIDVLTHEAGHAFQVYQSRWITSPELNFPTYESCEIHSMSMEFITWPWMELFFKQDTDKYKFVHLGSAIKFIPYGVVVDAFQHFVYENPEATKEERKAAWRGLEQEYLPHKNYEDSSFLEKGCWWFKQSHIFKSPFYYIDYTLAQICALQFWKKSREDQKAAWEDYMAICKVGGTKSFLEIVKLGNLKSPFEDGCVSSIVTAIDSWLESIDDKAL
ncbi:MAG: M3 family oligoendopeptidase [Cellulosilyticaceae bacterium]